MHSTPPKPNRGRLCVATASDDADPLLLPTATSPDRNRRETNREPIGIRQAFLQGMSRSAATVNILTTDGAAGRAGVTVSAMASVSADGDAPTLLACVHHLNPAADTILQNGCFAVNVLRDNQSLLSEVFAGRMKNSFGNNKFACSEWTSMENGSPRLTNPLVAFGCEVVSGEIVGTHRLILGAVQEVFLNEGRPLIYNNRRYGSPVPI